MKTRTPSLGSATPSTRGRTKRRGSDDGGLVALDPLIHERTRLTILTALFTAQNGTCSFLDLRDALRLTDGNLLTHLRTLEEAGMVERRKTGAGRGSSTTVHLTAAGRKAFQGYLEQIESLVRKARGTK